MYDDPAKLKEELEQERRRVRQLEEQLSRANEEDRRNRYLMRFLSDYIYSVRIEDGQVVETRHGPGCLAVTGYDSSAYRDDPELWYRMVHEDDRDAVTAQAQKALHGEEAGELQHRIIHRDGTVKWVRNTIVLVHNNAGHLTGYYGLINDITELKKAEQLTELKNRQLIEADKMATIGILASGIAHEINNPNNFIMLNTQFFSKIWEDAKPVLRHYHEDHGDFGLGGMPLEESLHKTRDLLEGIAKGSRRIQKIVNGLKEFTGSEAPRPVDLVKAIQNALLITRHLIDSSTDRFESSLPNQFESSLPNQLPAVSGHRQQLEQVIINLITNACQSLKDKNGAVGINCRHDTEQKQVIITVYDEGRGISEEELKYIFDPFYTTRRDSGGTGLGLSISYNIIKNHGGELLYDSRPGEGTRATIRLPVAEREQK